jgi:hypothetical protein
MHRRMEWLIDATTDEVTTPPKAFRLDFSVTNESARISPSRRLLTGEEITIHIRTGADWTPIAVLSTDENPGGILLMAYGEYGCTKDATIQPLGVYIDRL